MEKFETKDKKVIIYDNGTAQVVDPVELEKQKADIEARVESQPDDSELLEWARANYPMVDHTRELERLSEIDIILEKVK